MLIHVTLASDQPQIWNLHAQVPPQSSASLIEHMCDGPFMTKAARNGFVCVGESDFPDDRFDGYERKRTLTRRSFASRASKSSTFTFIGETFRSSIPKLRRLRIHDVRLLSEKHSNGPPIQRTEPSWSVTEWPVLPWHSILFTPKVSLNTHHRHTDPHTLAPL